MIESLHHFHRRMQLSPGVVSLQVHSCPDQPCLVWRWPKQKRGEERVELKCPHPHLSTPGAELGLSPHPPCLCSSNFLLLSTQKCIFCILERETGRCLHRDIEQARLVSLAARSEDGHPTDLSPGTTVVRKGPELHRCPCAQDNGVGPSVATGQTPGSSLREI